MDLLSDRLTSLDALRGFTIAAMILVNFPGHGGHVYAPLQHSDWHGLTFTDLIAPFFLFIVGVSITLAYSRQLAKGVAPRSLHRKIIVRAVKIFAVGMFLNLLGILDNFQWSELRWTGTLHRIAFVFLGCAFLYLHTSWRTQLGLGLGILVAHWLILTQVPTPGYGQVMLEPGQNVAAWIDTQFLPGKMWQGTWDPEGILSTFPAIVSGITGMLAGRIFLLGLSPYERVAYLMTGGLITGVAGYGWSLAIPLNENLWTSSFVLLTSGFAALVLGATYFLVDMLDRKRGIGLGLYFGANAITAYVLADLLAILFYGVSFGEKSLNTATVDAMIGLGTAPKLASMLYALLFVGINALPIYWLYRKKIFIKL
jgi:predicted acyltransferase